MDADAGPPPSLVSVTVAVLLTVPHVADVVERDRDDLRVGDLGQIYCD